jgi:hypothetical protein
MESFDDDARAVFGVLTDEPAVHWSPHELELQMGWRPERLEDALAGLERHGLIHRRDAVWPTRAAVRCHELLG